MAINPELITTIRVDQLPDGTLNLTNKIPHSNGTVLEKASIQDLVDLVATAVGVSGGVGYLALSVTDGQQLPDVPELPSFFLCGAGTFLNINGYPNIICTENLNAIMSLTDHWELAVEIPINPLSGTVQSVTGSAVDNTDPLNPIVNLSASTLQAILDNNHDLVDGINFQGTGAGTGNSGTSINGFGLNAGYNNSGNEINAFGSNAVFENSGNFINAFGGNVAQENLGNNVNALGTSAASYNEGNNVNAFGTNAGFENRSDNLNAFGPNAGEANTADYVNAFGPNAGLDNIWNNVNLFGESATADANNQNVFSKFIDVTTRFFARLSFNNITDDRKWELPDQDGTIALTSDIPAAQVNSDWNATSGVAEILNKPTIPSLTGYVPYTGATTDLDLGTYNLTADHIALNVSPSGAGFVVVGATEWNNDLGSSQTLLKGGNVTLKNGVDLVARVVNKVTPNTTLTKAAYQVVRVSGAQGQRLAVELAQANTDNNSADTLGIVIETIATNQEGFIITVGQIEGINTTGSLQGETWNDGDVLYLSPSTAGKITNIKPTGATGHIVVLGYVEYAHANNGKIYVKIMNGWELDELHNVYISSVANNQILTYESATQLWKNKNLNQIVSERRNANNTSNNNINYCGTAPNGSAESSAVWTIKRLTIAASGSITTATATNVAWTNRQSATYI